MLRIILIFVGFLLLVCQQYIVDVPVSIQYTLFIVGIVALGIPHGAADMLVTAGKKETTGRDFVRLILAYLFRLTAFALLMYLWPVLASILFILFAAYHFGETDLHRFKTETFSGKLFTLSYGLLIIAVIVLQHYDEAYAVVQPLLTDNSYQPQLLMIKDHRTALLSMFGLIFLVAAFIYFYANGSDDANGYFVLQFGIILIILYQLPLLYGFMFYFIVWHSILSLRNIFIFLRGNNHYSNLTIVKQIALYSTVAIAGVSLFTVIGMQLTTLDGIVLAIFIGLAVLTAPHMGVMYDMYKAIRRQKMETV